MNIRNAQSTGFFALCSSQKARAAIAAAIFAGSWFVTGCGGKEERATAVDAGRSASGGTSAVPPTPEQEAAKQRALRDGAAIHAANDPHAGGR